MASVAADLVVHVGADIRDATRGLDDVGNRVNRTGSKFGTASKVMAGGSLAIIGGLGAAVFAAADFEQGMANINAVTNLTGNQFDQLSELALGIGAATSFSATEGTAAIEELAKAGVPVENILNGAAMAAANLAEAGGTSIPNAAVAMSNSMNMFSLKGKDATMVADTFAAAASASASDVDSLAQGLAQGGPAAASFGISLQDTVTALAMFSNEGIQGSDAGTSLKTMLQRLAAPTDEAAALMGEMGIAAFNSQGEFVGLEALSGQLQSALGHLSEEEKNAALSMIFGADASRVAGIMAKEGAAGFSEMSAKVNDQGAAGRMAAARMDTLKGAIEQVKGSLQTAMIVIGTGFIPVLRKGAAGILGLVNGFLKLSPNIQKFVGYAAAGVAAFLGVGAAIFGIIAIMGPIIGGITALGSAFAGMIGFVTSAGAIFGLLFSPIGILVALIVGLAIAWKTNFLGIQDIVSSVIGTVSSAFTTLVGFLQKVIDYGSPTRAAMEMLPEPLRNLGIVIGTVVNAFKGFIDVISSGGSISQAFDQLTSMLTAGPMMKALSGLGGQILSAFTNIDYGAMGSALWNGFLSALSYIGDLAGQIITKIGDLGSSLKTWYDEAIDKVDWGGLGTKAGEAVGSLATTLATKAAELITGLGTAISENWGTIGKVLLGLFFGLPATIAYLGATLAPKALEFITGFVTGLGINWSLIGNWLAGLPGKITGAIPTLLAATGTKASELFTGFVTALGTAWPVVTQWMGGIGAKILAAVPVLTTTIGSKALELLTGFVTGLGTAWTNVVNWFLDWGWKIPLAVPLLLTALAPKALELLTGFVTGLGTAFIGVGFWLGELGTKILAAIPGLLATLGPKALELLTGFVTGLGTAWTTVSTWFLDIGAKILAAVPVITTAIASKATELLTGFVTALGTAWVGVSFWLSQVGPKALVAVGSLLASLPSRGIELLTGLGTGILEKWAVVAGWLAAVGSKAKTAVGGLLGYLPSRGTELITGLGEGILAKWNIVANWLAALGFKALVAVGVLGGVLYDAGVALLQGFLDGLVAKAGEIASYVQGIVDDAIDRVTNPFGWSPIAHVGLFAGHELGAGFADGIRDTLKEVTGSASMIVDATINEFPGETRSKFNASAAANVSSGQTTIYQSNQFDVHVDELEDVVEAARFVRDIDTSRTLYFSGAN